MEGRAGEEEEGKLLPLTHSWMGFQHADITVQVTQMGVNVGAHPHVCVSLAASRRNDMGELFIGLS